jgi:hypothetical protein
MKYRSLILAALFCSAASTAQEKKASFCSARTTTAYHSPECDWGYAVRDPQRVDDLKIPHKPAYHTYSRWVLDGRTYILAYRDIEDQPDDMVVDVYAAGDGSHKLIGNARIPGIVTGVATTKLTDGELPDVVIRFEGGQLQYVDILRFSRGRVIQVFQYGASTIEVLAEPVPMLKATSRAAHLVEQFAWDSRSGKFSKVSQYALQQSQ